MNPDRVEQLLERIAVALETIAAGHAISRPGATAPEALTRASDPPADRAARASGVRADRLVDFLTSKGISIKALPADDASDDIVDQLSLFLGERYGALASLLLKIKRSMQTGAAIVEHLKGRSQVDVASACQFCTRLHEVAFLEEYRYDRSPAYVIRARTTTLPKAQRFFGGQWLERFIRQRVEAVHAQIGAEVGGGTPFEHLINPQIILPNGDDFELDVLVALADTVYWIEAKSGDYQQHVAKYSKFARFLGLDMDHAFMVLADVPDDRCAALSALFGMTVCNLRTFEDVFLSVARKDTPRVKHPGDMDGDLS